MPSICHARTVLSFLQLGGGQVYTSLRSSTRTVPDQTFDLWTRRSIYRRKCQPWKRPGRLSECRAATRPGPYPPSPSGRKLGCLTLLPLEACPNSRPFVRPRSRTEAKKDTDPAGCACRRKARQTRRSHRRHSYHIDPPQLPLPVVQSVQLLWLHSARVHHQHMKVGTPEAAAKALTRISTAAHLTQAAGFCIRRRVPLAVQLLCRSSCLSWSQATCTVKRRAQQGSGATLPFSALRAWPSWPNDSCRSHPGAEHREHTGNK